MTVDEIMDLVDQYVSDKVTDAECGYETNGDSGKSRDILYTAVEALVRDAERINFLRWSKEIVIAKADEYGVLRKSSIPTLDAAIAVQGVK